MELNKYLPSSPEAYIDCFRRLAAITNTALDYIENNDGRTSEQDNSKSLKRVAEAVETISSLRGDSGVFYSSRPNGLTDHQKEMYATEDYLRERLIKLGYKYPAVT